MGKAGKDRKRQRVLNEQTMAFATIVKTDNDDSNSEDEAAMDSDPSEQDIAKTIDVLDALSQNINIFRGSDMKSFRIILHPLVVEQKDKHFERKKIKITPEQCLTLLAKESVLVAVRTLSCLSKNLELFRSKPYKQLRASLHPLITELSGTKKSAAAANKTIMKDNTSTDTIDEKNSVTTAAVNGFSGKISSHFLTEEWLEALETLELMRQAGQSPKLGALQRWIRDADLAPEELRFPLIDAVLRVTAFATSSTSATSSSPSSSSSSSSAIVRNPLPVYLPIYHASVPVLACNDARQKDVEYSTTDSIINSTYYQTIIPQDKIRIIQTIPGCDRPCKTDLHMHTLLPNTFVLSDIRHQPERLTAMEREDIPGVPGGFIMKNMLSYTECDHWLAIANQMGFQKDTVPGINHVLWLAEDALMDSLYQRVKPFLPATIDGCEVKGINARLRFFRYEPGAVYRIHIDGAWPGSGLIIKESPAVTTENNNDEEEDDGEKMKKEVKKSEYELIPVDDIYQDRYSRLTFLIYLNEDFEGGHTRYFIPRHQEIGILEGHSVKPRKGCIVCFPHGDAIGSLAHEGSSVSSGVKYVIRTEVLYTLPGQSAGRIGSQNTMSSGVGGSGSSNNNKRQKV